MTISDIEEETTDLEWFALDQEGLIGHFTTGGFGALPRSVASSKENLETISTYFRSAPSNTHAIVSSKAIAMLATKDEKARERYLQDFLKMASRGLYSFDYQPTGRRPSPYFLVAKAAKPLHVSELPHEIQTLLGRTTLHGLALARDESVSEEVAR